MKLELLHVADCPHVEATQRLVADCLSELGLRGVSLEDREGDFPSPSVLVNGRDVMGSSAPSAAACRLDVPTRERLLTALREADAR